jgi:hypothetical protein
VNCRSSLWRCWKGLALVRTLSRLSDIRQLQSTMVNALSRFLRCLYINFQGRGSSGYTTPRPRLPLPLREATPQPPDIYTGVCFCYHFGASTTPRSARDSSYTTRLPLSSRPAQTRIGSTTIPPTENLLRPFDPSITDHPVPTSMSDYPSGFPIAYGPHRQRLLRTSTYGSNTSPKGFSLSKWIQTKSRSNRTSALYKLDFNRRKWSL